MDVLLLGAAAIVLIALTVWLVWRPAEGDGAVREQEAADMIPPQGDRFEDQYTSATADLSAAGVAMSAAHEEAAAAPDVSEYQRASEPWSQPGFAREGVAALPEPSLAARVKQPRTIGIGAAAAIAVASAVGGAWLYARWQRQRNKPLNRVRRRFR